MTAPGSRVGVSVGQRVGVTLGRASGASAPNAPTIGLATAGNTTASVAFTPSGSGDPATSYTVTSSPGGLTATGASSPLVVTGLTNGTAYTFTAVATNAAGDSSASSATGAIMPLFFWGVYPVWHQSTLADGAITSWTDVSTGKVLTGTATKGSGKVTFNGTSDILSTTDATVCAFAAALSPWTVGSISECQSGTPAANTALAAWTLEAAATNYAAMQHGAADKVICRQQSTGGTLITNQGTADVDATRRVYIAQSTGTTAPSVSGYTDNTLNSTATAGTITSTSMDKFSLGGRGRGAGDQFWSGSHVVVWCLPAVMSSTQRANLSAYLAAGAPARAA